MNNTKWSELFHAFYENECSKDRSFPILYRTKATNGFVSRWSNEWENFGSQFLWWKEFEWLQIRLTDENRQFVMDILRRIHVPGEIQDNIATIYGYRQDCEYIE